MRFMSARQAVVLPLTIVAVSLVCIHLATRNEQFGVTETGHAPSIAKSEAGDQSIESAKVDESERQSHLTFNEADDPQEQRYAELRGRMVEEQLVARGISDQRVLRTMRRVPRHKFVPNRIREKAYVDSPLPIGHNQTISQPLIVAMMTQLVRPTASSKALDVGSGSGYQAAVLCELVDQVYSIEIVEPLAREARERLKSLGYKNVEVRCGDGYRGWPEHAPFDVIIVAAAPDHVPQPLVDQLAPGGRLVIPVGGRFMQTLLIIEKRTDGTIERREITPVTFVPMTGEAQKD